MSKECHKVLFLLDKEAHPKFNFFKNSFATINRMKSILCKGIINPGEMVSFLDSVSRVLYNRSTKPRCPKLREACMYFRDKLILKIDQVSHVLQNCYL